jgi:hypothetical protein
MSFKSNHITCLVAAFLIANAQPLAAQATNAIVESKAESASENSAFFAWSDEAVGKLQAQAKVLGFDEAKMKAELAVIESTTDANLRKHLSQAFRKEYYVRIGLGALRGLAATTQSVEASRAVTNLSALVVANLEGLPLPSGFLMIYEPVDYSVVATDAALLPCWTEMTQLGCIFSTIFNGTECVGAKVADVEHVRLFPATPEEVEAPPGLSIFNYAIRYSAPSAQIRLSSFLQFASNSSEGLPDRSERHETGFEWPLGPRDLAMCVDSGRHRGPGLLDQSAITLYTFADQFFSDAYAAASVAIGMRDRYNRWYEGQSGSTAAAPCSTRRQMLNNSSTDEQLIWQNLEAMPAPRCWFRNLPATYASSMPLVPYDAYSNDPDLRDAARVRISLSTMSTVRENGAAAAFAESYALWDDPRVLLVRRGR